MFDCRAIPDVVLLLTMKTTFSALSAALIVSLLPTTTIRADEAITLKSKIVPNKRYVVLQEVLSEMPMPLGGGEMKSTMSFTTNMSVSEIMDSRNRLISVDMGEVKMLIDAAGNKMEINSNDKTEQTNPMLKLLKTAVEGALKSKFDAEVDPEGNVIKVINKGEKSSSMLGGGFGEEDLKQLVSSMFDHGFPDKEISKGDTWTHKMETSNKMTGDLSMRMNYTYEGNGDFEGKSYPKLAVKGEKDADVEAAADAKKGFVNISKADSDGYILFDNDLGVARYSEMSMNTTMEVSGETMENTSKVYSTLIKVEHID